MIYITAPYIVRTETTQVGANDLTEGELCLVGKRLVIGNSLTGHPNFNREAFPYKNTELLSEAGPKVQMVFSEFTNHIEEHSIAMKIPANTNTEARTIVPDNAGNFGNPSRPGITDKATHAKNNEGAFYNPLRIYNDSYSLTIKYSMFVNNGGTKCLRSGTFRSLGSAGSTSSRSSGPIDSSALDTGGGPVIIPIDPFHIWYVEEPSGNYYSVQLDNTTGLDMTVVFSYVIILP